MAQYKNKKKTKTQYKQPPKKSNGLAITALALAVLFIASVVAGVVGWFRAVEFETQLKKITGTVTDPDNSEQPGNSNNPGTPEQPDNPTNPDTPTTPVEGETDGMVVSQIEGSLMRLTAMPLSATDGVAAYSDSTYILTATPDPIDATNTEVDWSVSWDKEALDDWGYYFYTDTEWYYDEDSDSDFSAKYLDELGISIDTWVTVTPTSDGALTATVTCNKEFGCPIIITCTSRDNSDIKSTCKVDYVRRVASVSVRSTTSGITFYNDGKVHNSSLLLSPGFTRGTVYPSMTYSVSVTLPNFENLTGVLGIDYDSLINSSFRDNTLIYLSDSITKSGDIVFNDLSWTFMTYDSDWGTFCDKFILQHYTSDLDTIQKDRDVARQLMVNLMNNSTVLANNPMFTVDANIRDNNTGKTFQKTYTVGISNIANIPVYYKPMNSLPLNTVHIKF